MQSITLYSTGTCPYCLQAELLLKKKGAQIDKIRIDQFEHERDTMIERSGRRTVPQIFVGEHHIGGFDDLLQLERQGKLSPLLQA